MNTFAFTPPPKIVFGSDRFSELPGQIASFGNKVLLVTGAGSYKSTGKWEELISDLKKSSIEFFHLKISGEPSPDAVDEAVSRFGPEKVNVVVGFGGGSVIDAGKAISAMLPSGRPVIDFLEGVGDKEHDGRKVPYIAVPTTAGTGSEATKNAVLSRIGENGFKKSLRHDNFVPDLALVDPRLMLGCPPAVTAACGLDAFTQLFEAYMSIKASPVTDALAFSGLLQFAAGFLPAFEQGDADLEARSQMAYASLMSGIVLANAGLGLVHGLASPVGGAFPIPHGVVCGTLVGEVTKAMIDKLQANRSVGNGTLEKFAAVGALLTGRTPFGIDIDDGCRALTDYLLNLTEKVGIARLGQFGIKESNIDDLASKAGNKNSPVPLDRSEIAAVLRNRL